MARTTPRPKAPNGAGSIRYDKARKQWRVMVTMPNGKRRTARCATPEEAEATKARFITERTTTGTPRPTGGKVAWTVSAWLDYWMASPEMTGRKGRHGTGVAESTKRRERWACDAVRTGTIGEVSLWKLTTEDVESFLTGRATTKQDRAKWSAASAGDVKNLLRRALAEAIKRGHAPAPNKADFRHAPGRAAESRHALNDEQRRAIYASARAHGTIAGACVALLCETGMRQGEARAARWGDVDLTARTIYVPKSKTPGGIRHIRLSDGAMAVIHDRLNDVGLGARDPGAYIFPGIRGRGRANLGPYAVSGEVERCCTELGIGVPDDLGGHRPIKPHEIRHTVTSVLLDAGVSPVHVAAMIGDTVQTMMSTYAHLIRPVAGDPCMAMLDAAPTEVAA
jgi:integrase